MTKKEFTIKQWKVTDINPAPYNPRDISSVAFEGLKESIKKFGLVDPLIVNIRNGANILVGGHQRLKAATSLEYEEVPVVEVDLSPAEEKALNVTLNSPKISGFYTDTLQELLNEIKIDCGDDLLKDLRLNELIDENSWTTDIEDVENIEENDKEAPDVIKITIPKPIKDQFLGWLKEVIAKSEYNNEVKFP